VPAETAACANCGAEIPVEEGYCPSCGTALGTRLCANGHVMDIEWSECRYCSSGPKNGGRSVRDEANVEPNRAMPDVVEAFGSRANLLEPSHEAPEEPEKAADRTPTDTKSPNRQNGPKHRTVYDPGLVPETLRSPRMAAPASGQGRLVGWLVSFSLDPSGIDFRLREGRNLVGADPDCDVIIGGERGISGKHAVIMYRRNQSQIRDNDSTNGTYVNGKDIFGQGAMKIETGDRIRLGQVELTLHLL